jgi:N-acetylmuramoyl-L-alanine amidase
MKARVCAWSGLFLALLWSGAGLAAPQAVGARATVMGEQTRFVIEMTENVPFEHFVLPDPYRVVIDLTEVTWTQDKSVPVRVAGAIEGFRYGLFRPGTSRVVLDLSRPMAVSSAVYMPPDRSNAQWRLVIDLKPVERTSFLGMVRKPRAQASTPIVAVPKPATDRRRVVVLDPGHGGIDPGATGTSGVQEKDITLALARELRDRLLATGRYRVVLSREGDISLSLADRVRFARAEGADLFLSIHADSIGDDKIHGATVYTLSETASDRVSELLATKENKSDIIAGLDLNSESDEVSAILIDLAQRETMNSSARFARHLLGEFGERLSQPRQPHRFAGFKVLKAPDVPSVLVEIGYMSNRRDEAMLTSPKGRVRLVEAVAAAVDRFFADTRAANR